MFFFLNHDCYQEALNLNEMLHRRWVALAVVFKLVFKRYNVIPVAGISLIRSQRLEIKTLFQPKS